MIFAECSTSVKLTAINNTIFFRKGREHAKIQMIILYSFLKLEEHMSKCTKNS